MSRTTKLTLTWLAKLALCVLCPPLALVLASGVCDADDE